MSCAIATSFERIGSAAVQRLSEMLMNHTRTMIASGAWVGARFDGPPLADRLPAKRIAPHLVREFGRLPLDGAIEMARRAEGDKRAS